MLDRQLIGRFIILRVLGQTAFQLGRVRQVGGLAQKGDLRFGAGEGGFVIVAFYGIQHGLGFAQLTAFGQAARVEDQRTGVGVVLAQQRYQYGFGIADTPFGKQRLGLLQRVRRGRRWHLHMGLQHRTHRRFRLRPGKPVHRLTVLEQHHRRQAADTKARDDILLGIAIDLGQQQLALITLGNLRQHRHQRLARRAPLGPEIHEYRFVE